MEVQDDGVVAGNDELGAYCEFPISPDSDETPPAEVKLLGWRSWGGWSRAADITRARLRHDMSASTCDGFTADASASTPLSDGNTWAAPSQGSGVNPSHPPTPTYADMRSSSAAEGEQGGSCGPSMLDGCKCDEAWYLRIYAEEMSAQCSEISANLRFKVDLGAKTQRRVNTPFSACQPGSGRFWLLPYRVQDANQDGAGSALLLPVLVDAYSGRLTNHAWISNISVVEDLGYSLRVSRVDKSLVPTSADSYQDLGTSSLLLSAGANSISANTVSGYPAFLVEGYSTSELSTMEVDMSWSCSSAGAEFEALPAAYLRAGTAMGCDVDQLFALRPMGNQLRIELYGNASTWRTVQTTVTPQGRYFDHQEGGARVRGYLQTVTAESAQVQLLEASLGGVELCSPGTWSFARE